MSAVETLLCACAAQVQGSTTELWTWTDANGVTHFSDRPVPGARRVQLATGSRPAGTGDAGAQASPDAAAAQPTPPPSPAAPPAYTRLEIWQPDENQTFFGGDAEVNVRLLSDPELASGHRIRLFLNGTRVQGADNDLEFPLGVLVRGSHTLTATIVDRQGAVLIRSAPRVFNVQQPTVNQPRGVGPSLRPPAPVPLPRPQPGPRSN